MAADNRQLMLGEYGKIVLFFILGSVIGELCFSGMKGFRIPMRGGPNVCCTYVAKQESHPLYFSWFWDCFSIIDL
jgi:hypothetical protein